MPSYGQNKKLTTTWQGLKQKIDKGRILEASGDIWNVFTEILPWQKSKDKPRKKEQENARKSKGQQKQSCPKKNPEQETRKRKKNQRFVVFRFSLLLLCFSPRVSVGVPARSRKTFGNSHLEPDGQSTTIKHVIFVYFRVKTTPPVFAWVWLWNTYSVTLPQSRSMVKQKNFSRGRMDEDLIFRVLGHRGPHLGHLGMREPPTSDTRTAPRTPRNASRRASRATISPAHNLFA